MFTLLSLVFGCFLWGTFLLGFFIIAMLLIEGFVRIVRLWKPGFLQSYQYKKTQKAARTEKSEHRLIALDFIIQERIRRQTQARKQIQEQMFGIYKPTPVMAYKPSPAVVEIPDEVSFDEIAEHVADPQPKPSFEAVNHAAEYAIAHLVNGKKRYLCEQMVKRLASGEIEKTVVFAALRDKAKRLDRMSAQRWLTVLPSDCFVEAFNAAARVAERTANGFVIQGIDTQVSPTGEKFNRIEEASA